MFDIRDHGGSYGGGKKKLDFKKPIPLIYERFPKPESLADLTASQCLAISNKYSIGRDLKVRSAINGSTLLTINTTYRYEGNMNSTAGIIGDSLFLTEMDSGGYARYLTLYNLITGKFVKQLTGSGAIGRYEDFLIIGDAMYACASSDFRAFTSDGTDIFRTTGTPTSLNMVLGRDSAGNFYCSQSGGCIVKFDSTGKYLWSSRSSTLSDASNGIVLENGDVIVGFYGSPQGVLYLFDGTTGAIIKSITGTYFPVRVGENILCFGMGEAKNSFVTDLNLNVVSIGNIPNGEIQRRAILSDSERTIIRVPGSSNSIMAPNLTGIIQIPKK